MFKENIVSGLINEMYKLDIFFHDYFGYVIFINDIEDNQDKRIISDFEKINDLSKFCGFDQNFIKTVFENWKHFEYNKFIENINKIDDTIKINFESVSYPITTFNNKEYIGGLIFDVCEDVLYQSKINVLIKPENVLGFYYQKKHRIILKKLGKNFLFN